MSDTNKNALASITCQRTVVLKTILTDKVRVDLNRDYQKSVSQINQQILQINSIMNEQKSKNPDTDLKEVLDYQKKLSAQLKMTQDKIDALNKQALGTEYVLGTIQGESKLRVGDDVRYKVSPVEVLTRDYIVEKISIDEQNITGSQPEFEPVNEGEFVEH